MTEITHPVLPLRDIVIFPHMIAPLFVGRIKSINALESVMDDNKEIIIKANSPLNKRTFKETSKVLSILTIGFLVI